MDELDEARPEGSALEEVSADEDVVDSGFDDGVHSLPEGLGEGSASMLSYGEGYRPPYMGVSQDGEFHVSLLLI